MIKMDEVVNIKMDNQDVKKSFDFLFKHAYINMFLLLD